MKRVFVILLAIGYGLILVAARPAIAARLPDRCAVPDSLIAVDHPLPAFKKRLAQSDRILVIVIGSASSMMSSSSRSLSSYVRGFESAFRAAFQGKTIEIRNLSSRTQSGVQMAQRIVAEVIPARPDLVIWQTGTVEASRHIDPNSFSESLALGLRELRAAHIDLVLIGPQTRNRLASMIDVEPYNDLMAQIADRESVPFLSRFDIMTFWEENDAFDIRSQDQAIQMSEAGAQSQCIAQLLADQIRRAVAATP